VGAKYDVIGRTYARTRRADPRIAAKILDALGDARSVVNVGAGTGSYEPRDRRVVAVEPSATMVAQRDRDAAPAAHAVAEALPFATGAFDAAMATLTMRHWNSPERGAAEMRRVARRHVVLFFDLAYEQESWLVRDYFPASTTFTHTTVAPGVRELGELFAVRSVDVVPVPSDCTDGFAFAFWNRPEAYLDAEVQAGISLFANLDDGARREGTARLADDLATGAWDVKYGHLRSLDEYDAGYRLLVAGE
jgi:SAM-dependent methyltransferase